MVSSVLTLVLSIAMVSSLISSAMLASIRPVSAFTSSYTTITKTPIKHLVILFQENVSFDHYFGTYPFATNPPGEPRFIPAHNTPSINGLTGAFLNDNPNGNYSINPFRLDRSQAVTCDMNHVYTAEQQAYH